MSAQVSIPAGYALPSGKMLIGGAWVDGPSGQTYTTFNPATEAPILEVADGDAEAVNQAVAAAKHTFASDGWRNMKARDRGRLLWKLSEAVAAHIDELAWLETLDNGKPIIESKYADMNMVVDTLQYYASWTMHYGGETLPLGPNTFTYTLREPLGVIGAIVAWNFPLMLAMWKIAPALATGNTVVIKPAPSTPLSLLRFAELATACGLPAGALNVVTGSGVALGEALVNHPDVAKIAFTGSTRTGIHIMKNAADSLKKVSLELGGKSPNIVFDDCDMEAALKGASAGIFYGKGEVCAAGSRLLVQDSIYDSFVEKLAERAKKLVCMDPLNPKCRLGALVSQAQLDKVSSYVQLGLEEGASLVAGGQRADIGTGKGYFHQATVLAQVQNHWRVAQEEIFGPVLSVIRFKDEADATLQANASPYGLAAGIWTKDVKRAHRMVRALQAGTVWVNAYNQYDAAMPFGGYKASGMGREMGQAALEGYTQSKSVFIDLT